ncbi:EH domain-containing protein 4, partial [Reticulomyxa filosa]
GHEKELFADLEQKYILSGEKSYKRKELNRSSDGRTDSLLRELSDLYHKYARHVEEAYQFSVFHTPLLNPVDFTSRPMVMLVGQYSTGKTTFIRYLIGRDFPGMSIGPEPTTDCFSAIMYGNEERLIPGHTVTMDTNKPFRSLTGHGAGFLNKFNCVEVPSPLLDSITFVDTPGILSGEKQRLGRNYEFSKVDFFFF